MESRALDPAYTPSLTPSAVRKFANSRDGSRTSLFAMGSSLTHVIEKTRSENAPWPPWIPPDEERDVSEFGYLDCCLLVAQSDSRSGCSNKTALSFLALDILRTDSGKHARSIRAQSASVRSSTMDVLELVDEIEDDEATLQVLAFLSYDGCSD